MFAPKLKRKCLLIEVGPKEVVDGQKGRHGARPVHPEEGLEYLRLEAKY